MTKFHVEPRQLVARFITLYQATLSPDSGVSSGIQMSHCPFFPRCSEYAKQAVLQRGVLKGAALALRRVVRCHPGRKPTYDPVS